MTDFLEATAIAIGVSMVLSLYRLIKGPTHFDRLIGLGLIGTKTVVLFIVLGMLTHTAGYWVDLSLTYALISFIGTLALAKFFEVGGRV